MDSVVGLLAVGARLVGKPGAFGRVRLSRATLYRYIHTGTGEPT